MSTPPTAPFAPALQTRGLTRRFGDIVAVDNLDLLVEGPGVHGFLGPNGAGKSTTMKMVLGLLRPTAGEARIRGETISAGDPRTRAHLAYLPQDPAFPGWMTGLEYVVHTARLFGQRGKRAQRNAEDVLERCGLSTRDRGRKVAGYSGGMKQRLGVAQALVNDPHVLFLDEPVSALDPRGRGDVLALIEELGQTATVFMSTHILADVERVCARLSVLKAGRLLFSGPTDELMRRAELDVVELVVRDASDHAIVALRALPGVVDVTRVDDAVEGRVTLRLRLGEPRAIERAVPVWAATHEVALIALSPARPTLEEVFLRLVGEGEESAS